MGGGGTEHRRIEAAADRQWQVISAVTADSAAARAARRAARRERAAQRLAARRAARTAGITGRLAAP